MTTEIMGFSGTPRARPTTAIARAVCKRWQLFLLCSTRFGRVARHKRRQTVRRKQTRKPDDRGRRPAAPSKPSGGAVAGRAPTTPAASKASGVRPSTTAGRASAISTPSRRRCSTTRPAPSSPATTAPTSPSTGRSTPIAAASTAASIASRGRRTAISAIRPGSTSRPSSTPRPTPPSCWRRSSPQPALRAEQHRARHQHRPLSADRARAAHHARHPGGAGAHRPSRSASSPSRRSSCATSTSWSAWRHAGWPRSRISVTTLDRKIARTMEPRAATPPKRLEAMRALTEAGIPVTVMVAPDHPRAHRQRDRAHSRGGAEAGAASAGYVLLRLPLEIKDAVPRVARHRVSRSRRPRASISCARCTAARITSAEFGIAPARPRTLRRPDRPALPPGIEASRHERAPRAASPRSVSRPGRQGRANAALLKHRLDALRAAERFDFAARRDQTFASVTRDAAAELRNSTTDLRAGIGRAGARRRSHRRRRRGRPRPMGRPRRGRGRRSRPRSHSRRHRRLQGARCRGRASASTCASRRRPSPSASALPRSIASSATTSWPRQCGPCPRRWPAHRRPRLALIDGNRAPAPQVRDTHRRQGRRQVPVDRRRVDHRQGDARPHDDRAGPRAARLRLRAPQGLRHPRAPDAIDRLGVTVHHRRSFRAVQLALGLISEDEVEEVV